MAVGVASPAVGHDSAANGGGSREEGAAPAEEGSLGMRVEGKRVAAPVDGAPAEIAVEGDEAEEEADEEEDDDDEEKDEEDDDEEEEEEEEDDEEEEEEEDEKWLGQYSSTQSILLVGDGDFSFSLVLATGFGSGANLVATSLDTYEALCKKFTKAESNITGLKSLGVTVLHGIDVKTMKLHTGLKNRRFDRIVFNFPHAGFKGKEYEVYMINLHKELVREFFRNARHLLRPYGEIHVSHKTGKWYDAWGLEDLAAEFSLILVEKVGFQKEDYPGYHQKKGDGPACDKPFPLGNCFTFKFKIGDLKKRKKPNGRRAGSISSIGGDTRPCHALPLVQPCSGLQFAPPAYTVPPHVFDQRPLNFVGIPRATFIYRPLHVHCSARQGHQSSLMNALGTPGCIPSPMGRISSTSLLAPQGYPRYEERIIVEPGCIPSPMGRISSTSLFAPQGYPRYEERIIVEPGCIPSPMGRISSTSLLAPQGYPRCEERIIAEPGCIPSPVGRISSTSLLAPQGYPRYEERIIAEPLGNTDYFACEYQRSLLREYRMQGQLMPEGTNLNYSAFLEARQSESVRRQERLRRMIAYGSQWDRRPTP